MTNSQSGKRRKGKSKFWKDFTLSERITWIGTILGLIVDTIAILQVAGIPILPISSSFLTTPPYFAVSIWILAIFTYFALMHSYWERHQENENLYSSFGGFLVLDLLLEFHKPFLLLPLIVLLLIFFPIALSVDSTFVLAGVCGGFLVIGLFFVALGKFFYWTGSHDDNTSDIGSVLAIMRQRIKENRLEIEANWDYWEKRIYAEFERKWAVTGEDFKDIKTLKGYGEFEFEFIFATFASKFPDKARFGTLLEKDETGEYKKFADKILVNLDKYNRERYWID